MQNRVWIIILFNLICCFSEEILIYGYNQNNEGGAISLDDISSVINTISNNSFFKYQIGTGPQEILFWQPYDNDNSGGPLAFALVQACVDYINETRDGQGQDTFSIIIENVGWSSVASDPICVDPYPCPDILLVGTTQVAGRTANQDIQPLSDYLGTYTFVSGTRLTDDFLSSTYYDYFIDNDWYAIPFTTDFRLLFFNRTSFDKYNLMYPPPLGSWDKDEWSWNKFVEYAQVLTNGTDYGFSWNTGYDEETKVIMMIAQSWGATLLDSNGKCRLQNARFMDAMNETIMPLFVQSHAVNPLWIDTTTPDFQEWVKIPMILDDPVTQSVIALDGTSGGQVFGMTIAPPLALTDSVYMNNSEILPALVPGKNSFSGGAGLCLSSFANNGSWDLILHLVDNTRPYLSSIGLALGAPPPYHSVLEQEPWIQPRWDVSKQQVQQSLPSQYPLLSSEKFSQLEPKKPFRYMLAELVFKNGSLSEVISRVCMVVDDTFLPDCTESDWTYTFGDCNPVTGFRIVVQTPPDYTMCKKGTSSADPSSELIRCTYLSHSSPLGIVVLVVVGVVVFVGFVLVAIFIVLREETVVRDSKLTILVVFIFGTILISTSVLLMLDQPTQITCILWVWLFCIGYIMSIGCIFYKVAYVRATHLPEIQRHPSVESFSDLVRRPYGLWKILSILVVGVIGALSVWTWVKDTPGIESVIETKSFGQVSYVTCSAGHPVTITILVGYLCLLTFYCLYLTIRTRNVPGWTDRSSIILTLSIICTAGVLCGVTVAVMHDQTITTIVLKIFCILVVNTAVLSAYCLPKLATAFGINPLLKDEHLALLPEEISSIYKQFQQNPKNWIYSEGFYFKKLTYGKEDWNKSINYFEACGGNNEEISEAYAVYNPMLLSNFVNWKSLLEGRWKDSPELFNKESWVRKKDNPKLRFFVKSKYEELTKKFNWNHNSVVPIVVSLHGTDFTKAFAIAKTGFVALSTLDAGYYGKGVYFTTNAQYVLPYILRQDRPAIIISFVTPGNVYPAIEGPKSPETLMGGAIKPGYNSHYVLTTKYGQVISEPSSGVMFDELVVDQESQVLPVYILSVNCDRYKKGSTTTEEQEESDTISLVRV